MPPNMRSHLRNVVTAAALVLLTSGLPRAQSPSADPLEIARILAARYPAQPIMSYIPALAWSGQLRLFLITRDTTWRDKAMRDIEAFTSGRTPAIAEPYRLTSLAGALAFAEASTLGVDNAAGDLAKKVAAFINDDAGNPPVKFTTGWTDDMFMASAVLSRVTPGAYGNTVYRLLTSSARKLQRPDGLFIHAENGPHAWGRGNGFALLGVTEALRYLGPSWAGYKEVLGIYRKHVAALAKHQSDDGSWRQVIDDPTSYRELTVTAMTAAALARGIANEWIDPKVYEPIMNRGWQAVAARVNPDGTVRDVCSGTGAGPTKEYYLNRPVVNGADDRGGAMALLAAVEMRLLKNRFH
jgi:unsaturated rhamnogalacturonyl hydrolase